MDTSLRYARRLGLVVAALLTLVVALVPAAGAEDCGESAHPSGNDRCVEAGGSGTQGDAQSDPDDDTRGPERSNGGADEPNGPGGVNKLDQDGNNGCGNDQDFEDDNEGLCGGEPDTTTTPSEPPTIVKTPPKVTTKSPPKGIVGSNIDGPGDDDDESAVLSSGPGGPTARAADQPQLAATGLRESLAVAAFALIALGVALVRKTRKTAPAAPWLTRP